MSTTHVDLLAVQELLDEGVPLAELAEFLPPAMLEYLEAEVRAADLIDRVFPEWLEHDDIRDEWQLIADIIAGRHRDGVHGDSYATLETVGDALGVTREAVRLVERGAMRRLARRFPHLTDLLSEEGEYGPSSPTHSLPAHTRSQGRS